MHKHEITLPELGLLAATRAMLGAGIGLLVAGKLNDDQRQGAGWSLLLVGALTTIPLAIEILGHRNSSDGGNRQTEAIGRHNLGRANQRIGEP